MAGCRTDPAHRSVDQQGHRRTAAEKGGYSLRVNHKRFTGKADPDRDAQFERVRKLRRTFKAAGQPVISIDTKKKELVGNFANAGRTWCRKRVEVNAHDFRSDAECVAAPYGIYDVTLNRGFVCVGTSRDVPRFAVDCLVRWWRDEGRRRWPDARELLVLADAGGSNSARSHVFKARLQERLADAIGLTVTVAHYPAGASKWNPIEHRLFGPISTNWAGEPLRDMDTLLGYIRGTTTATGLRVRAVRMPGTYEIGERIPPKAMKELALTRPSICPKWNYTITPRSHSDYVK